MKFKVLQFRGGAWEEAIGGTFEADDEPAALAHARHVWGPHSTAVPADYEERARKTWEDENYDKQTQRLGRRLPRPGDQLVCLTLWAHGGVLDRRVFSVDRFPDDGEFYAGGSRCAVSLLYPMERSRKWPAPISLARNVRPFIYAFLKDEEAARAHLIEEASLAFATFANEAKEERLAIEKCQTNIQKMKDAEIRRAKEQADAITGSPDHTGA